MVGQQPGSRAQAFARFGQTGQLVVTRVLRQPERTSQHAKASLLMACFADRNSFAFASNIFNFTVDLGTLWQSAAPGFGRRKARVRYNQ
jgi:hypothetical protein